MRNMQDRKDMSKTYELIQDDLVKTIFEHSNVKRPRPLYDDMDSLDPITEMQMRVRMFEGRVTSLCQVRTELAYSKISAEYLPQLLSAAKLTFEEALALIGITLEPALPEWAEMLSALERLDMASIRLIRRVALGMVPARAIRMSMNLSLPMVRLIEIMRDSPDYMPNRDLALIDGKPIPDDVAACFFDARSFRISLQSYAAMEPLLRIPLHWIFGLGETVGVRTHKPVCEDIIDAYALMPLKSQRFFRAFFQQFITA